jgi:tRNA nucleotidyltransferase (CCA-adding enzyme)
MRTIVASGELATLAPERIWQELAKGLSEARPSRMLAVLRECGALAHLLPEVDALFGIPVASTHERSMDAGVHVARALDWLAEHGGGLAARFAMLALNLAAATVPRADWPVQTRALQGTRLADKLSARLKVPIECKDAARLAARWCGTVHGAAELRPAAVLGLLHATDALRRPARLYTLLETCAADAYSQAAAGQDYPPASILRGALAAVKSVDAGVIAREVATEKGGRSDEDIAKAVRAARLKALRAWRRAATNLR